MKILLASSEVYPFSKTGGLADMVGALGRALGVAEHAIRVFCDAEIRAHLVFQLSKQVSSLLRRSRYYIANRSRINEPEYTKGFDEISGRFYEGAAAGAVAATQATTTPGAPPPVAATPSPPPSAKRLPGNRFSGSSCFS